MRHPRRRSTSATPRRFEEGEQEAPAGFISTTRKQQQHFLLGLPDPSQHGSISVLLRERTKENKDERGPGHFRYNCDKAHVIK